MIRSLEDAEKWYRSVRSLALDVRHLAKLWDREEIAEILGRDNRLREVKASELMDRANAVLEDLDPLAVFVLFAIFEATVRDLAEADFNREIAGIQHPAVLSVVEELRDAIKNGSLGKITAAYKKMDVSLTEEVNQVRKFRNWVAHGRREEHENQVTPKQAIDRLSRYLDRLTKLEEAATTTPDQASGLEQPPDA